MSAVVRTFTGPPPKTATRNETPAPAAKAGVTVPTASANCASFADTVGLPPALSAHLRDLSIVLAGVDTNSRDYKAGAAVALKILAYSLAHPDPPAGAKVSAVAAATSTNGAPPEEPINARSMTVQTYENWREGKPPQSFMATGSQPLGPAAQAAEEWDTLPAVREQSPSRNGYITERTRVLVAQLRDAAKN